MQHYIYTLMYTYLSFYVFKTTNYFMQSNRLLWLNYQIIIIKEQ